MAIDTDDRNCQARAALDFAALWLEQHLDAQPINISWGTAARRARIQVRETDLPPLGEPSRITSVEQRWHCEWDLDDVTVVCVVRGAVAAPDWQTLVPQAVAS